MLKMVPTAEFTSMLEEPSRGSNSTAYLPTGVLGGDRDDVLVFLRAHGAHSAGMLEAILDGFIGKDVELLLLFPLHVEDAGGAKDVDQAGPSDGGRDDLGGERDVVEKIGQLPRRFGVAVLLVQDEAFNGGNRASARGLLRFSARRR